LAKAHYAKSIQNYLREQNINFVQEEDNPPNLPECRPIEDFWGVLKGSV
jgi:lipoate synthase